MNLTTNKYSFKLNTLYAIENNLFISGIRQYHIFI